MKGFNGPRKVHPTVLHKQQGTYCYFEVFVYKYACRQVSIKVCIGNLSTMYHNDELKLNKIISILSFIGGLRSCFLNHSHFNGTREPVYNTKVQMLQSIRLLLDNMEIILSGTFSGRDNTRSPLLLTILNILQ